ncbi:MAG: AarF/ABC1/UbiB kinase family protein, partial [Calditrichaeota bacterium]|nr:AarF/ABC1/UbiB kinase family protein [Calditrichota bacterium]
MKRNPIATYRSVLNRFVQLYKHVLGLIIGAFVVSVRNLSPIKRKGLRSAGRRVMAFFLKFTIKKELRNQPFEVHVRRRLEMLGPTYVKLGQIMAIREDILPKNITGELKQLLDHLPEVPFESIRTIIEP